MRQMFRYPFGVFEWYKGLPAAHPWQSNWVLSLTTGVSFLVLGKGAEKLVCQQPPNAPTRASRFFVPYWMRDYRADYAKP